MKKNQKILVAVLAIVIVLAVVIFAIAMNKNTNEETSNSNVETSEIVSTSESTKVESSTEVLASIGTAPEDSTSSIDKSDAINFPGDETSSTSESTTSETSSTTESSTSKTKSTTESTTSKTETSVSSTSESSTSESTTSKTETSTSETSTSTEPTTSESSTTPSTPVDNSSSTPSTPAPGEQITQGSTGTTSFGTTYPIVSEFNKLGLDSNSTDFFSTSGYGSDFAIAFGEGNRAISDVLGYPSTQIAINVTNTYISCLDAHITRQPDKSQYIFTYADNITTDSDGGTIARARHQVMLGAITSTPVEVEQALFEDCFTDNEHFSLDTWVTVGDCQIRFVYSGDNGVEYAIRPLN